MVKSIQFRTSAIASYLMRFRPWDICVVQDLIDMTLKKMDIDKDGRICYEDFETTVGDTLSHLQSFGDLKITFVFHLNKLTFQ